MVVLENVGKIINDVAQVVAKKSGEMIEVTRLNLSINAEEDRMQEIYEEIGIEIYEGFKRGFNWKDGISDKVKNLCSELESREKIIEEIKEGILKIKEMKVCSNCGSEVEKVALFCPKCGANQKTENKKAHESETTDFEEVFEEAPSEDVQFTEDISYEEISQEDISQEEVSYEDISHEKEQG